MAIRRALLIIARAALDQHNADWLRPISAEPHQGRRFIAIVDREHRLNLPIAAHQPELMGGVERLGAFKPDGNR